MPYLAIILSPFNILFFILALGFAIGKIRTKGISLGTSGILFVAIFAGLFLNLLIPETNTQIVSDMLAALKTFSRLGSSLFVSIIGLQTGFSIKSNSKDSLLAFIIGSLMSVSGVVVMILISVLDKSVPFSSLLGILCGALTSTPGLSSVCDLIGATSNYATWGYGCSYLLGVIFTVFFARLATKNSFEHKSTPALPHDLKCKIGSEVILISLVSLLGSLLDVVCQSIFNVSLGHTAFTLLIGLLAGYLVGQNVIRVQISDSHISVLKELGLALFFAGTGFSSGTQYISFDIKAVLYGGLITLAAILCGKILCKALAYKFQDLHEGHIIAGGMTSSPAYGTINDNANAVHVNIFSFAYLGSLLTLIISLQVILKSL